MLNEAIDAFSTTRRSSEGVELDHAGAAGDRHNAIDAVGVRRQPCRLRPRFCAAEKEGIRWRTLTADRDNLPVTFLKAVRHKIAVRQFEALSIRLSRSIELTRTARRGTFRSAGDAASVAAVFIIATIKSGSASRDAVRSLCGDLPALLRAVGFRDIEGNLSCVMGIGSDAWDVLFGAPRPAELHPFREIDAGPRHAAATPGDLLFHIRAKRMDLCFELATQIMARLGDAVTPVDEVHGFRFFDDRDLIGFVDGMENLIAQAAIDAAYIGAEDKARRR